MQQKINTTKNWCALLLIGFFGILLSCSSDPEPKVNVNINVDSNAPNAADGFNLEQFHRLLLEEEPPSGEWDAAFLSELVNREDINNLDLNQDGTVDQIFIEPFGGGDNVGFQLYVQVKDAEDGAEAEEQTICTVGVEKESDGTGSLAVSGNEQVYGNNHHYHSGGMGFGSYMMLAWMMSPRYSMMGGGYGYGGYGGGRRVVSQTTYNKNINNRNSNHTGNKAPAASRSNTASSATSGAKQKTASNVKAGLKKPTSTQRKFQTQQKAKKGAGGFAKKPSGTSKSTSAGRSSSARSRGGK